MPSRYFKTGATLWNLAASWSSTASSGVDTAGVPTAADDAIFDAGSGSCTVNVASVCLSLNFTGYTGTLTMSNGITVSGSLTLSNSMTISGASGLTFNASGTWTSNGRTWPNNVTVSSTSTITISGSVFTIGGTLTLSASTTFTGSFGFSTVNFTSITSGLTHTIAAGVTYSVTGVLTVTGTFASRIVLQSSTTSHAIFNLTGTQDCGFFNGTWINSSAAATIWTYGGVLSNTLNWLDFSVQPLQVSSTFIN
jgi:hypothetical protein